MNKRLVILSVPIIRLSRVLLSDNVLDLIKHESDVLIVSPFSEDNSFQKEFGGPQVSFFTINPPDRAPGLVTKLYTLSELMRTDGYYCRYRNQGLKYYWSNITRHYGVDGEDTVDPLFVRIMKKSAGFIGIWRRAWQILDRAIGKAMFRSQKLETLVNQYNQITLIQSASWGYQDRMLAWNARQLGFRSVFVPYTTDQLWVNGYLLCEYDAICVQGDFEARCVRDYHGVASSRVVRLGSVWFRAIDDLLLCRPSAKVMDEKNTYQIVVYAGSLRCYFPQESEFQAVDALIIANQNGLLGHTKLVYRPCAMTTEERRDIEARYSHADIQLQYPEQVCCGLHDYSGGVIKNQLLDYLEGILKTDVLIMAQVTSLALDVAYMGGGVIADFADDSNLLEQRRRHLLFSENGQHPLFPGVPVVHSSVELITQVQIYLQDKKAAKCSADAILTEWDYFSNGWKPLLQKAIWRENTDAQQSF